MSQQTERSVVVGVDFGQCGDDAVIEALKLLQTGWASIVHLVHVLDPADVIDDKEKPALETEEEVLARAPAALRERFSQLSALLDFSVPAGQVQAHARVGKTADTILQAAVDYDADLIVVGTHGRRGLDRLVLGSVAERLARVATCPVFVARPKDHSHRRKSERPDPPYKEGETPPQYRSQSDRPDHISTENPSWSPGGSDPTGIRIV